MANTLSCSIWHIIALQLMQLLSLLLLLLPVLHAVATLAIPTAIFDQDVRPKKGGIPPQGVSLRGRADVAKASYDGSLPLTINQCLCHSMTGQPAAAAAGSDGSGSAPDISEADVAGAVAE
jgi:uncharacterized MAPEG superfamily protein